MSWVVDGPRMAELGAHGRAGFVDDATHGFYRFLSIGSRRAYEVGSRCDTCELWFTRLDGADTIVSVEAVADALRSGLNDLDSPVVARIGSMLRRDTYHCALLELEPRMVYPGSDGDYFTHEQVDLWGIDDLVGVPHNPTGAYYRTADLPVARDARLFEFALPLSTPDDLDSDRVDWYRSALRRGGRPTAVAVAVLDVKQPAICDGEPDVTTHWCLTHCLLDGHHKMFAAARERRPVRLLSFIAERSSNAMPHEITTALELMDTSPPPHLR